MEKDKKNEIPKEVVRFFRDMDEKTLIKEYGQPRPLDKSFMMEDKKRAKARMWRRTATVIAGIMLFLGGYSYGFIQSNTDQAFAGKGLIQRVYESIMGVDTDRQDNNAADNTTNIQITDINDLDEAEDLISDLYFPGYLPTGYDFVRLSVKKSSSGVNGKYEYKKGSDSLYITLTVTDDDGNSYVSNDSGNLIELKDRLIYAYDDDDSVTVLMDTCMIMIRGDTIPQQELIKIAKGLDRYKWD